MMIFQALYQSFDAKQLLFLGSLLIFITGLSWNVFEHYLEMLNFPSFSSILLNGTIQMRIALSDYTMICTLENGGGTLRYIYHSKLTLIQFLTYRTFVESTLPCKQEECNHYSNYHINRQNTTYFIPRQACLPSLHDDWKFA